MALPQGYSSIYSEDCDIWRFGGYELSKSNGDFILGGYKHGIKKIFLSNKEIGQKQPI